MSKYGCNIGYIDFGCEICRRKVYVSDCFVINVTIAPNFAPKTRTSTLTLEKITLEIDLNTCAYFDDKGDNSATCLKTLNLSTNQNASFVN